MAKHTRLTKTNPTPLCESQIQGDTGMADADADLDDVAYYFTK